MRKLFGHLPMAGSTSAGRAPAEPAATPEPARGGSRKTSALPGSIRGLMDKVTARKQIQSAKQLDDEQVALLLDRDDLSGRATRALQKEARKRRLPPQQNAARQAAPQPAPQAGAAPQPAPASTHQASLAPASPARTQPTASIDPRPHAAPPDGPVVDPDTGALDKARLRQTVDGLLAALPGISDEAAFSRPSTLALHNQLKKELREAATAADDDTPHRPDELGLAVRDAFAKAARTSTALARSIERGLNPGGEAKRTAAAYALVAGLMTELKRTHLSAAALDIADHYAKREVANLERVAPGISQGVSGPNVGTSTGAGVAWSAGAASASAGVTAGRNWFSDDDRDIDFWTSYGLALKGGIGNKVAGWAAKLTGSAQFTGGGVYFEHDNLHELVKLIANLDANRSWIGSAGPNARKLMHGWQTMRHDISRALGRNFTESADQPYYLSDKKIAKGFNGAKLALLSMALDEQQGGERFTKLIGAAYPSAGDLLRQRHAAGEALPAATRRDVPDSVAYADRRVAYRQYTASADAALTKATPGGSDLEASGTFDLNLKGDLMQFFTETANAPHQLLDPAYRKDLEATLELHRQLDEACMKAPQPQFHLYDAMRRALGGAPAEAAREAAPLSEHERTLFGDEATVPAQFRHVMEKPSAEHLALAGAHADRLGGLYRNFVDDAQQLLARNDKFMPRALRAQLHDARAEAFARINDEVWNGRYPEKKALADPETFVARSHAAISLALGCAGTHIGVVKQRMAARPEAQDEHNAHAIRAADASYDATRRLLDKIYLPLKKYDVQKNGPLKDRALWQRWDGALKLSASGGADANLVGAILGRWKKSLGPVSITNDDGELMFSAEAKFLNATHQVNPSRQGKFWQITLNAQGGAPLAGSALHELVVAAVKRLNAGLATDAERIDVNEALRQVQGLALDVANGSSVVIKFRQAPGLGFKATDLQYARVLSAATSGIVASATLPSHAGTFTPSVSHTDSGEGFVGEVMGPDLSYLMMQHPKLQSVLDQAGEVPDGLRALFDANPRVRDGYFASPDTIVEVVSRYAAYLDAKRAAAAQNRPLAGEPLVNEFHRYYATGPFARAAEVASQTELHAPGTTAHGAEPFETPAPLADDIDLSGVDLGAARRRLQATQTIGERAAYFCGEGRSLLDAFAKIVGNTRAVNSAAMFHVGERSTGIETKLRDATALTPAPPSAPAR
ncbi:type III effector protein [Trinickia terrae]|uniref:Type III effector protein n=1 Tax=Trinickia terrae TaxID=2571161 RepID=A0A4U1ICX1_9BURK|nr:type III effector protein [Trinickia terrae]TKC91493.1 type III effector protein [Trinickia terrae]